MEARRFNGSECLLLLAFLCGANSAEAGRLDGEIGVDFARSEADRINPMTQDPETLGGQELGLRWRVDLFELDDRLEVHVDYRGREPISGDQIVNATQRLLYRAEVGYEVIRDTLSLSLGRFIPRSALFLPVDGLRVDVQFDELTFGVFGGRRGISTSRHQLPIDRFLPAAGAYIRYANSWWNVEIAGAYARDEALLLKSGDGDDPDEQCLAPSPGGCDFSLSDFDAVSFYASGFVRPHKTLFIGAYLSFLTQGSYVIGPGWRDLEVEMEAVNLLNASGYVHWRALKWFRVGYDAQFQRSALVRGGSIHADGVRIDDEQPQFIDNRLKVDFHAFDVAWIRGSARLRLRRDRLEQRYRLKVDADDIAGTGIYVRGSVAWEDIAFDDVGPDLDRLLWSAGLGYRGFDLDVSAGARFIDRKSGPVPGLRSEEGPPAVPENFEDLAPYVFDAQRVVFLRAFYGSRWVFGGLDVERSLDDDEWRVLVQVGTFMEFEW